MQQADSLLILMHTLRQRAPELSFGMPRQKPEYPWQTTPRQGWEDILRARTIASKPISITPPPEVKLLRSQLGPEQGTT